MDDPAAAQKVAAGIYQRVQALKKFPKTGHIYRIEPDGEIRILLYKKDKQIEVLGVFHGALDIDRYLS